MQKPDELKIEVLEDGTIRVESDEISGVNHLSAEAFLRYVSQLAGSPPEIKHKQGHTHSHTGTQIHQH